MKTLCVSRHEDALFIYFNLEDDEDIFFEIYLIRCNAYEDCFLFVHIVSSHLYIIEGTL